MRSHHGILAAATTVALVACGGGHEDEDIDAEACEHLASGPYTPVTATATSTGAPAIADDHMAYTITLPAGGAGNSGFVSFAAAELGYYGVFFDQAVTATFTTSAGAPITPAESTTSSPACAEVRGRYMVPLEVGTAFLELSSPTVSSVNLVIELHVDHEH